MELTGIFAPHLIIWQVYCTSFHGKFIIHYTNLLQRNSSHVKKTSLNSTMDDSIGQNKNDFCLRKKLFMMMIITLTTIIKHLWFCSLQGAKRCRNYEWLCVADVHQTACCPVMSGDQSSTPWSDFSYFLTDTAACVGARHRLTVCSRWKHPLDSPGLPSCSQTTEALKQSCPPCHNRAYC